MAFTVGKYGPTVLGGLFGLIATFYFTSTLFIFVVPGSIARVTGFSILKFLVYIEDELLIVFGASSSESAWRQCRNSPCIVSVVVPAS